MRFPVETSHSHQNEGCFTNGGLMCTVAATMVGLGSVCGHEINRSNLHRAMVAANGLQGRLQDRLYAGQRGMMNSRDVIESLQSGGRFSDCLVLHMVIADEITHSRRNFMDLWGYAKLRGRVAAIWTQKGHSVCTFADTHGPTTRFDSQRQRTSTLSASEFDEMSRATQVDVLFLCNDPDGSIERFYNRL
jgi:hypothetical protein